ncbi:MAG: hypothetical protein ABIR98_14170 [Usitatibacter sp.]
MIRRLLAWASVFLAVPLAAQAASQMPSREAPMREAAIVTFRAPSLALTQSVRLDAPLEKSVAASAQPVNGPLRVADVRGLPKAAPVEQWVAIPGGFVARFDASSALAEGLRVRLDLAALADAVDVRVQGADGVIVSMEVQPGSTSAWTPWTEGSVQVVEVFSRAPQKIAVGAILHFTESPLAKVAGSCTLPTLCTTNDAALDAAIVQRKKSMMRISFVENGGGFLCTATLINTERFPAGFVLTANHCINNADSAASVTSLWFYELSGCDAASPEAPGKVQVAGGMQLVLTNANVDSTLLLMPGTPPVGATYAGWNAARLSNGTSIVSLSHPTGDSARLALGSTSQELRIVGHPIDMYGVRFTRGIIQGGSSGSGLFTLTNGSLQLRGVLSGTTIRHAGGMSCTNLDEEALYGRFDMFHPEIDQYIRNAPQAPDDAPNRPQDLFNTPVDAAGADLALNLRTAPVAFDGKRIDYAGDLDTYRFILTASAVVSTWTEGPNIDTVGAILDSRGVHLESDDDAQAADNHFGITRRLDPGTYYVQVGHFEPAGTGTYNLRIRADNVEATNHTALWWNAAEPGWGLNVNHQGNKVFATLFTYDATGPMWLVMSDSTLAADGAYQGTLLRTTGPAFNTVPFSGVVATAVGTMRIAFSGTNSASLTYTFNGTQVIKSLTRQEFATLAECSWSAFDRTYARNFQDLWYNAAEPGWGVNLTHQGNKLFATLFTYEAGGRGTWLVMSDGTLGTNGNFSGPLYRTSGPLFSASPWVAATATQVGTMSFAPSNGNAATLSYTFNGVTVSKQVTRQAFANVKPLCE